jgi:hypothetical protein
MGRALRRAAGVIVVFSLLVAAAAYYLYSPELALTAGRVVSDSAEPAPNGSTLPTATPPPSPTVAPTTAERDPTPPIGGRSDLVVRVERRGVFAVTETVRLSAPVTQLDLAPPDLRLADGGLDTARAVVTDVDLSANDRTVRLVRRSVRQPTTVALERPADRFELRYRLHGTIRRAKQSQVPGRALGAVAPVVVGLPGDLPVSVAFRGSAVLNVTCPGLPAAHRTCFAGRRPAAVRVGPELPRQDALVMVQLDLLEAG